MIDWCRASSATFPAAALLDIFVAALLPFIDRGANSIGARFMGGEAEGELFASVVAVSAGIAVFGGVAVVVLPAGGVDSPQPAMARSVAKMRNRRCGMMGTLELVGGGLDRQI